MVVYDGTGHDGTGQDGTGAGSAPEAVVTAGRLRGARRHGVLEFLGVPYAAPLVGAARFAPPAPVVPWSGVRDATEHGPAVAQVGTAGHIGRDALTAQPQGAESLHVAVRTPGTTGSRPVLVWFHGGGLFAGSNAEPQLGTRAFAADGVVEVVANYRLGMAGYLDLGDGSSPNRGLLDQVAVLDWVRREIRAFGGDPDRVTIGGHSAGGFACAELLASPRARGLFHRVVLGSGSASARHTRATAEAVRALTVAELGVRSAAELVTLPDGTLLAAQQRLIEDCYVRMPARYAQASVLGLPFAHTLDPRDVADDVPRALAEGVAAGIPLLVLTTTGESRAHVAGLPEDLTDEQAAREYDGMVRPLGVDGATAVRAYRRMMPSVRPVGLLAALNADLRFTLDSIRVARAQAPHAPTYRLVLGESDESFGGLTPHGGIQGHAWRTPPGHPVPDLRPQHRPLTADTAEFLHSAVRSFVEGGPPTSVVGVERTVWPAVDTLGPDEVLLRDPEGHRVVTDPAAARLHWWGDRLDRSRAVAATA